MKRVFISYAHEDREFVARLAGALASTGVEVWWDRRLEGGHEFRAEIEESLNAADAVVVVWSGRSRASRWVLDEAEKGLARSVLVPVRVDRASLPLGFGGLHTLDFTAWDGAIDANCFAQLADRLAKISLAPPQAKRDALQSLRWGALMGLFVGAGFAAVGAMLDAASGGVTVSGLATSLAFGIGSAAPVAIWAAVRARRFAQSNAWAVLSRMARTYALAGVCALALVAMVAALSFETVSAGAREERFSEMAGVVLVGTLVFGALIAAFNGAAFALARLQRAR